MSALCVIWNECFVRDGRSDNMRRCACADLGPQRSLPGVGARLNTVLIQRLTVNTVEHCSAFSFDLSTNGGWYRPAACSWSVHSSKQRIDTLHPSPEACTE
jgi:hypothetical protein